MTAAVSAWKPNRLPTAIEARIRNGVVNGLVRKVIAAAIGMLPRTGSEQERRADDLDARDQEEDADEQADARLRAAPSGG